MEDAAAEHENEQSSANSSSDLEEQTQRIVTQIPPPGILGTGPSPQALEIAQSLEIPCAKLSNQSK